MMLHCLRQVPVAGLVPRAAAVLLPRLLDNPGLPGPILSSLPLNAAIHTSTVLERARQSTRIRKRKKDLANKKKKEERLRKNPPPLPKKIQLMMKAKGLGSKPIPWREIDLKGFPEDSSWSEWFHTWHRYEVDEALDCLREYCHPTMINMPNALVWAKLEFNMANVKKDKYIDSYTKMVPVYHPYERGVAEKIILVFCKQPEEAREAEAAGARKTGGSDLIQDVLKGKMDVTEYDHFLATEEIAAELKPLLGVLRDKFPQKKQGTVAKDIGKLVKTFAHGMLVSVKKPPKTLGYEEDLSYAVAEATVGRLDQTSEQIKGNLMTMLETLKENQPKRNKGGFITRCQLYIESEYLSNKFSISHDLIDDEKYSEHKKAQERVPADEKEHLETILEEAEN